MINRTPSTVTWPVDYTGKRCKCSAPFILTPPTSNSDGAWTYSIYRCGLDIFCPAIATINSPTRTVTPLNTYFGEATITATQAATPKYAQNSISQTLQITDGYNVGEKGPGGGIVFFVAPARQTWGRYLEAAPTYGEVSGTRQRVAWGCNGTDTFGKGTVIGSGKANTATILKNCNEGSAAARVAAGYRGGGMTDWFLPSKDEMTVMDRSIVGVLGAENDWCWSSSEVQLDGAWGAWCAGNGWNKYRKDNPMYVRPVRAF